MELSERKKREIRALAKASGEALAALAKRAPIREEDLLPRPRHPARMKNRSK